MNEMVPCVYTPALPPGKKWAVQVVPTPAGHATIFCAGSQYFTVVDAEDAPDESSLDRAEWFARMFSNALRTVIANPEAHEPTRFIDIVFDGPPGHMSGRFIEVENQDGKGIGVGTWVERSEEWRLRITLENVVAALGQQPPPMVYATEEQMREAGPSPAEMARAHAEDVRRRATQPMAEVGELTKRIRAQQGPMLSKEETVAQINEVIRQRPEFIIPCVLFCPHCKKQHIDEGIWATRPHRTHQCVTDAAGEGCGSPFTPSAHRTVGVWYKDLKFTALEEPKEPKR